MAKSLLDCIHSPCFKQGDIPVKRHCCDIKNDYIRVVGLKRFSIGNPFGIVNSNGRLMNYRGTEITGKDSCKL